MSLLTLSNALSWVKLLIYFCALGRRGSKQGYKLPLEIWGLLLGGSLNVPVGTKCVTVTLRYTTENLMEFFSGLEISFEFSLCFLISIVNTVYCADFAEKNIERTYKYTFKHSAP